MNVLADPTLVAHAPRIADYEQSAAANNYLEQVVFELLSFKPAP